MTVQELFKKINREVCMDIRKYNTDHLTFGLNRVLIPESYDHNDDYYQLVIKYDCEWIFNGSFDSEEQVERFLEAYHKIFIKEAELIRSKLYAYKQALCKSLKENLDYIL